MNMDELTVKVVENERRCKSNTIQLNELEHLQEEMSKMLNIMYGIRTEMRK